MACVDAGLTLDLSSSSCTLTSLDHVFQAVLSFDYHQKASTRSRKTSQAHIKYEDHWSQKKAHSVQQLVIIVLGGLSQRNISCIFGKSNGVTDRMKSHKDFNLPEKNGTWSHMLCTVLQKVSPVTYCVIQPGQVIIVLEGKGRLLAHA